jgi:hypothetical protein
MALSDSRNQNLRSSCQFYARRTNSFCIHLDHSTCSLVNGVGADDCANKSAPTLCNGNKGTKDSSKFHPYDSCCCSKARKNSTPRPTVKFYDIKSKIFSKTPPVESGLPDDDEDDSWLDEAPEKHGVAHVLDAETSSPIDPASRYLTTFLGNEKETRISDIISDKNQKATGTQVTTVEDNDNDFSMNFD